MGCIVFLAALAFPRITLAVVWLTDAGWLAQAYGGRWIWPVLGFVFLPLTTLAYAYGMVSMGRPDEMEPLAWLLVALALLIDLGALGGGGRHAARRRRDDRDDR
ncbi:MAG: hypothetical protein IT379_14230 [Deltaproteobacteria bacterium]|nr:hypothetical protein [Deltaproteobacteria bacterium]